MCQEEGQDDEREQGEQRNNRKVLAPSYVISNGKINPTVVVKRVNFYFYMEGNESNSKRPRGHQRIVSTGQQQTISDDVANKLIPSKFVTHHRAIVEQNAIVPRLLKLGPSLAVLGPSDSEQLGLRVGTVGTKGGHKVTVIVSQHAFPMAALLPFLDGEESPGCHGKKGGQGYWSNDAGLAASRCVDHPTIGT